MSKSAIEAPRGNIFYLNPSDPNLVIIGLDTQDTSNHPLYDARIAIPLREATVLDIMSRGVIEPIAVRKDGDRLIVVDGRRRVMHAREANKRLASDAQLRVPCLSPLKGSDGLMATHTIALNEHREQDSPINRARKAQRLLSMGYSEDEAAAVFGFSTQTLAKVLSLLDLTPAVQTHLEAGDMTLTEAYRIAELPRDEQELEAAASRPPRTRTAPTGRVVKTRAPRRSELARHAREGDGWHAAAVIGIRYAIGELSREDAEKALERFATKRQAAAAE